MASTPLPPDQDLTLLLAALSAATNADVVRRIAAAGHPDLRPSHGYVFQHLITGPLRITDLATRLGMTLQGASKLVLDLERLGYVGRHPDPTDGRNRIVELTPRGWAGIEAGRAARASITADLRAALDDDADAFVAALKRLSDHTGALDNLLARRLRPQ